MAKKKAAVTSKGPARRNSATSDISTDKSKANDAERRARQAGRHARTLRVLQCLQGKGRWNAQELARELECNERVIYRDIEVLRLAGLPIGFDKGTKSYRLLFDVRFPIRNLQDDELLGQATATAITSSPGLDVTAGAKPTTRKLSAASNEATARLLHDAEQLVQVLGIQLADHSRHHETIRTVQWALVKQQQLAGDYATPYKPKPVRIKLHPYRLCLVKQAWYLIAKSVDAEFPKTYRIARFNSLRAIDAAAIVPDEFDLRAYFGNAWAVFRGDRTYKVELLFTKEGASLAVETQWHHSQEVRWNKDGTAILSFQVDGLGEIVHWILGWTGRVKVIQPTELRELAVGYLKAGLRMNEAEHS